MENLLSPANLDIIIKLSVAILCGMVVGIERTIALKTAGMRTYALVAMGSALFVVMSEMVGDMYMGTAAVYSPIWIPAAIITGIGFLGAGLIIFKESHLTGVTTASSIWVSAGIGIAAGFGLYSLAIIATILTLIIFVVLWFVEQQVKKIPEAMDHHNGINHTIE